jgi:hypothetical protein
MNLTTKKQTIRDIMVNTMNNIRFRFSQRGPILLYLQIYLPKSLGTTVSLSPISLITFMAVLESISKPSRFGLTR